MPGTSILARFIGPVMNMLGYLVLGRDLL